ncbi:MAG: response regulator transcription factor [Dyadobacter sp.]|uniref:response regulator transcription factor n=1 Tax=Dyadobacter sp. TaxID=1914288 RepID=UPI001B0FD77B|nr:response regulator transcription factor [Dyadobacter sp.]MBO9611834.1 response regulator transcription factor [Dyadobacter sp.]
MKRILIVDDHSLVRFGLKVAIEKSFSECEADEAWNSDSAMALLKKNQYDLVLLDLAMPETDPGDLLHWMKNFHPETRVLVVSMNDERVFAKWCLQSGAHGYIEKDASPEELFTAINTVVAGRKYMSVDLTETIINETLTGGTSNPFDRLSPREYQVAMYLIRDYSLVQISEQLQVQYSSVSTIRRRLLEKLNVKEKKDLVQMAQLYHLT